MSGYRKLINFEAASYVVAVGAVAFLFYYKNVLHNELNSMKAANEIAWSIQVSVDVEKKIVGRDLAMGHVINEDGQVILLYDLLREGMANIAIITSLGDCGECRNLELKRWGAFAKTNSRANVIIISQKPDVVKSLTELSIESKGLSGLPAYFDNDSEILNTLDIVVEDTPLIMALSRDARVVACYTGNYLTQERSDQFLKLIEFGLVN